VGVNLKTKKRVQALTIHKRGVPRQVVVCTVLSLPPILTSRFQQGVEPIQYGGVAQVGIVQEDPPSSGNGTCQGTIHPLKAA
jgi:hypothetical protein